MGILTKLKSAFGGRRSVSVPPHHVEHPMYVIGDIHGRMDLLTSLTEKLDADCASRSDMRNVKLVYVGDYIDRGDQSADVLSHLFELSRSQPERQICLAGNHEAMMLDFLEDPEANGARWLRYGGMQTLASFGMRGLHERMPTEDLPDVAADLRAALPDGMGAWLRGLRKAYRNGNVVCVHASLNPNRPWDSQSDRSRLWGHKDFFTQTRTDGTWVAHGHTIVDQARVADGLMSLDTGAYATGVLTALGLSEDQAWMLQTGSPRAQ